MHITKIYLVLICRLYVVLEFCRLGRAELLPITVEDKLKIDSGSERPSFGSLKLPIE